MAIIIIIANTEEIKKEVKKSAIKRCTINVNNYYLSVFVFIDTFLSCHA